MVLACRDLTRAKLLAEELRQQNEKARISCLKVRSEFLLSGIFVRTFLIRSQASSLESSDFDAGVTTQFFAIQVDLADFDSVDSFTRQCKKHLPRIDVLILNAGVAFCPYDE